LQFNFSVPGIIKIATRTLVLLSLICPVACAQPIEVHYLRLVNERSRPAWDNSMHYVSLSVYPVASLAPIGIWWQGHNRKDEKMINNGFKSAITICAALAVSTSLKYLVQRERPYVAWRSNIVMRDTSGPHSFPSGHTTAAFATATAAALSYRKWYVVVPSYLYAGMVAYSRMRLGVHYPTDVLGGMVLGIGSGLLTWKIDEMIREKKARDKQAPMME
jgi:membrane-associated phospholipid phosphatase